LPTRIICIMVDISKGTYHWDKQIEQLLEQPRFTRKTLQNQAQLLNSFSVVLKERQIKLVVRYVFGYFYFGPNRDSLCMCKRMHV